MKHSTVNKIYDYVESIIEMVPGQFTRKRSRKNRYATFLYRSEISSSLEFVGIRWYFFCYSLVIIDHETSSSDSTRYASADSEGHGHRHHGIHGRTSFRYYLTEITNMIQLGKQEHLDLAPQVTKGFSLFMLGSVQP